MFVSEQRLGERVGEHDPPVAPGGDRRVRQALEHGAQRGLAPAQPVLQALRSAGLGVPRPRARGGALPAPPDRRLVHVHARLGGKPTQIRQRAQQWGVDPIAPGPDVQSDSARRSGGSSRLPCQPARRDRRMDATGAARQPSRSWKAASGARPPARERADREREPLRPGGCRHPGSRPRRRSPGRESPVLQPGAARSRGATCARRPRPCTGARCPAATACRRRPSSGAMVTIDTVSHEGILEDQGRDPVAFFGRHGIAARARCSTTPRRSRRPRCEHDGPCVVSGPVAVRGAEPGDVLRVDVLGLVPRVPLRRDLQPPRRGHEPRRLDVHARAPGRRRLPRHLPVSRQLRAELPLDPYLGIMGVAGDDADRQPRASASAPRCILPVLVPGAKFFAGDPHYAQEGAIVLEAPLRATFRLTVLPRGTALRPPRPRGYWVARGATRRRDAPLDQRVAGVPHRRARDAARGGLRLPGGGRPLLL